MNPSPQEFSVNRPFGSFLRKLVRDLRWPLIATGVLLFFFPFLWALIARRMLGQIAPFFEALGQMGGISNKELEEVLFSGPGKLLRTLIGGERVDLNQAMDFLSVCLVHPALQTILALWAVFRSTQCVAGEVDRGTMELLLAQPISRFQVWLGHLLVETGAMLLLAFLTVAGLCLGAWYIDPIKVEPLDTKLFSRKQNLIAEVGPFRLRFEDPVAGKLKTATETKGPSPRLQIRPWELGGAFPQVLGLMVSLSGLGIVLSVLFRRRFLALGVGVMIVILMFLINLLGQLWEPLEPLRPLTAFYYYLPQESALGRVPVVDWREWLGAPGRASIPTLPIQLAVGLGGWLLAWVLFRKRDIPAPL